MHALHRLCAGRREGIDSERKRGRLESPKDSAQPLLADNS